MTPEVGLDEYVRQWSRGDLDRVRRYPLSTLRAELWPWLLERGYASPSDADELPRFGRSLGRRGVDLRPGLRVWCEWPLEAAEELDDRGTLVAEIRDALRELLAAIGEPDLPA